MRGRNGLIIGCTFFVSSLVFLQLKHNIGADAWIKGGIHYFKQIEEPISLDNQWNGSDVGDQRDEIQRVLNGQSTHVGTYPDLQKFQAVVENKLHVFSAYLDRGEVRLLGFKLQKYNEQPKCEFLLDQTSNKNTAPPTAVGKLETIPEHHGRRFTACYVCCKIPKGIKEDSILAVKVSPSKGPSPGGVPATVPISQTQDRLEKRNWKSEFTVCLAPIQNNYNNVRNLVEMIEINRLLGAERLVVYNFSIGTDVNELLQHYKNTNFVEIIDWPLTLKVGEDSVGPDIHYYGQMIAQNDCLYRNRDHSKYIVITDIDEFIFPKVKNISTWKDLIEYRKKKNKNFVVFQFRNTYFREEWPANNGELGAFEFKDTIAKNSSVVLASIYRENKFFAHDLRSKNIVDPLGVKTVGIHNIWKAYGPIDRVPESDGYLHHYKDYGNPETNKHLRVRDDSVLKTYGPMIAQALEKKWKELKQYDLIR